MESHTEISKTSVPWNKGRLVGQKAPLKLKEIWAIRIRLQLAEKARDLALFNLAIDSKLRGCDLVSLRVLDVAQGKAVLPRAMIMQHKTHRPVQFEITEQTRQSVSAWIDKAHLVSGQYLFPSRVAKSPHLSTRQYAHCGPLGGINWFGCIRVWHPHYETDKSDTDLPEDKEPAGRPTSTGTYETREHSSLPWHRG